MAYVASLNDSQKIAISLQGRQTQITLTSSSPGQQQSQSSSFSTGKWLNTPKLLDVGQGFVLQIDTEGGSRYINITGNRIDMVNPPSDLQNYFTVDLKEVGNSQTAFKPIEPMPSMQPMKMGDMSMDINSMSMQMGDMSLKMNDLSKTVTNKQFCSQCGTQAQAGDRFCRSCGHELNR